MIIRPSYYENICIQSVFTNARERLEQEPEEPDSDHEVNLSFSLTLSLSLYININRYMYYTIHIYIYVSYFEKISITTATKNYTCHLGKFFLWFSADFAILRRFWPLCVVFDPSTTATRCKDAQLWYVYIYISLIIFLSLPSFLIINLLILWNNWRYWTPRTRTAGCQRPATPPPPGRRERKRRAQSKLVVAAFYFH